MSNENRQVGLDYFLYSCLETERTVKAKQSTIIEWPVLKEQNPEEPSEAIKDTPLARLVTQLVNWYANTYPVIADQRPIDIEQLSEITEPLVFLNQDIAKLYLLKIGEEIPAFEKSVGNLKVWDDIEEAISQAFPTRGRFYNRYVEWSHAAVPADLPDPGSRPPVGRHAPPRGRDGGGPRGRDGGGGRGRDGGGPRGRDGGGPRGRDGGGGRGRDGGGGRGRDGGGGRGRDGGGGRGRDGGGPRGRDGGGGRGGFQNRGGQGNDKPRRGGRDGGGRSNRGGTDNRSVKMEETAMLDVYHAIKKLKKESDVNEIVLKPTNSFYRRIQHQTAVEQGYESSSVGEGMDRAVCVSKKS